MAPSTTTADKPQNENSHDDVSHLAKEITLDCKKVKVTAITNELYSDETVKANSLRLQQEPYGRLGSFWIFGNSQFRLRGPTSTVDAIRHQESELPPNDL
uniref:TFIIIC_sub6 domain-containing protein n=1 Tax=Steinernema glaseri TaxID=37863 RepID=A0A1I7ZJE1_9BILA